MPNFPSWTIDEIEQFLNDMRRALFLEHNRVRTHYPPEWRERKIQRETRQRDGHRCQCCGMWSRLHKERFSQLLHTHHQNGDKSDCSAENLITLCNDCHAFVHSRRRDWGRRKKKKHRRSSGLEKRLSKRHKYVAAMKALDMDELIVPDE